MSDENLPAVAAKPSNAAVPVGTRGLMPKNMDELVRMAIAAHKAGLAPRGMQTAEQCLVVMQMGMEAGLTPLASLRAMVTIQGNPTPMWKGEAALGLIRSSAVCRSITFGVRGDGDAREAWVKTQRADMEAPAEVTFSIADAKRAGLTTKDNWKHYPDDMLHWRAIGRMSKRYYSDVLMGFGVAEDVADYGTRALPEYGATDAPLEPDPLIPQPDAQAATDADFVESGAPASAPADRGQQSDNAAPAGARTDSAPQDPLHAEALEAVRAALRAAGATRFPAILSLAKDAGVDERRVTACWDGPTRSLHLERLSLDELTMIVDHHERKQG